MAQNLKKHDDDIRSAIAKVQKKKHGVVALVFTNRGKNMKIEILDEPYEGDVRVYPGH